MTAIMDLSFPGQRTATAISCIPHDSVIYMALFVVIIDSKYSKMTPKYVKRKSHWLHSSIKFANPAYCLQFGLQFMLIVACGKQTVSRRNSRRRFSPSYLSPISQREKRRPEIRLLPAGYANCYMQTLVGGGGGGGVLCLDVLVSMVLTSSLQLKNSLW